jgi:hypothetical protein
VGGTDVLQTDKRPEVSKPADGLKTSTITFGGFRLPPDGKHEAVTTLDIGDHAPAAATMLWIQGVVCDYRTILVIDNAGRRWRLRPGRSGPAKRAPRGRKREDEYEPRDW